LTSTGNGERSLGGKTCCIDDVHPVGQLSGRESVNEMTDCEASRELTVGLAMCPKGRRTADNRRNRDEANVGALGPFAFEHRREPRRGLRCDDDDQRIVMRPAQSSS
jgi:hypothetical protein